MKAKKTLLAVLAGTAMLGVTVGAQARDGWREIHRDAFHGGHGKHGHYNQGHRGHGHYRHHAHRHYAPAPVYYAPRYYAPRYYAPAPVYYEPAPVIYGRIPLGHHSSIGFTLPLGY
jgi:hypothetical protein